MKKQVVWGMCVCLPILIEFVIRIMIEKDGLANYSEKNKQ